MSQRVLFLGPSWLGDAVMAIPTFRALRRARPEAHVTVLARGPAADLYSAVPAIDEVIVYQPAAGLRRVAAYVGMISRLEKVRADVAIVLPRSFGSAWTAFLSCAPRRIGYSAYGRAYLLTDALRRTPELLSSHRVRYMLHLLTPLGIDAPPEAPLLEVPEGAARRAQSLLEPLLACGVAGIAAFNPGANYGTAKQWPEERYAELARLLLAAGDLGVALVGGPGDHDVCDRVCHAVGDRRVLDLSGQTTVPELAAVLARSAFLVTNDTGAMHVAAAVGTPVVAIFGPTDPRTTPPYGERHVLLRHPVDCSPCLLRECPIDQRCMLGIEPERVLAACLELAGVQATTR
ncbi:MAG: lipopolysaccharide heptosyltransferase II [Planctomycetes bacterium]|nr:lipopolysaccharide heptosyltransferase II [Planctomycetota bacterium]